MKKSIFILVSMSLLMAGKAYSQKKDQLIRYDERAFENAAKNVNHEDYNNKQKYALEVFRTYCDQIGVQLSFTENDYNAALGKVSSLEKNVSDLENAKQRLDENLTAEKEKSSGLEAEKRELTSENNNMKKLLSAKAGQDKALEQKEAEIADLRGKIANLDKENADLKKLSSDYSKLENEKNKALSDMQAIQAQLNEKNNEVAQLTSENNTLKSTNEKFQKAFDGTKKTINSVYNTYSVKPITDMDPVQLESAQSSFLGMKSLLAIDQTVYKDLEGKVNEMASWKKLVEPMRDAKQYLKGKYDDKTLSACIAAINKVPISGSKASEKQSMLTNLNNQIQLKENYDIIIRNLDERGCLPNVEQLKEAEGMLNRRLEKVEASYQSGVYDSYDRGINMIKAELSKSAPSNKVKTAAEFEKFINELREIF